MKYSSCCPNTLTHKKQVSRIEKKKKPCVSEKLFRGPFRNAKVVLVVGLRCEPLYMSTYSLSKVTYSINISPADFKLGQKDTEGQRRMLFLSLGPTMSYFACLVKVFHWFLRDLARNSLRGWCLWICAYFIAQDTLPIHDTFQDLSNSLCWTHSQKGFTHKT